MTGTVDLRVRFSVDDEELSRLHARAFGSPDAGTAPWRARLERYSVAWVGAFDGNELVGFVHACGDGGTHAFVLDTIVDPGHQRRGIASALIQTLRAEVTAAGYSWLHVDYEPALETFYASCGFRSTLAGLVRLD